MKSEKKFAIIVAGGSGNRMKSEIPKQFIRIGSLPILMHTIKRFHEFDPDIEIILVLPEKQVAYWEILCEEYGFKVEHLIVHGGETRFQSVKNGLEAIEEEGLVAIHDGVRPFVSLEIIAEAFETAKRFGNGIVSVPLKDSIRELTTQGSMALNRENFRLVQTPQCFDTLLIKKAYQEQEKPDFTDDASVVENIGARIILTEGSYSNFKITTPEDLITAEAFIKSVQ